MIGSWEEECKDTRVVFFSNCSHLIEGFFGYSGGSDLLHSIEDKQVETRTRQGGFGTQHGLGELRLEVVVWNYPFCCQVNRKYNPGERLGHPPEDLDNGFWYNDAMKVLNVKKRIRPVKYCTKCSVEMDRGKACPKCKRREHIIPNPSLWGMRSPRYARKVEEAIKAAKKPKEDLWVRNRPLQGGRGK
jgi:hypothetical protein